MITPFLIHCSSSPATLITPYPTRRDQPEKHQGSCCSFASISAASNATAASTSLAEAVPCRATCRLRPSVFHQRGIARHFFGTGPMWPPRISALEANTAKSSTRLVSRMVFIRTGVPELRIPSAETRVSRCQRPEAIYLSRPLRAQRLDPQENGLGRLVLNAWRVTSRLCPVLSRIPDDERALMEETLFRVRMPGD